MSYFLPSLSHHLSSQLSFPLSGFTLNNVKTSGWITAGVRGEKVAMAMDVALRVSVSKSKLI